MSYGWARTEILGALINGTFLISLCLYVTLEAIPEYIQPSEVESGWYFVIVAAAGLVVNTVGTIVFACMYFLRMGVASSVCFIRFFSRCSVWASHMLSLLDMTLRL